MAKIIICASLILAVACVFMTTACSQQETKPAPAASNVQTAPADEKATAGSPAPGRVGEAVNLYNKVAKENPQGQLDPDKRLEVYCRQNPDSAACK